MAARIEPPAAGAKASGDTPAPPAGRGPGGPGAPNGLGRLAGGALARLHQYWRADFRADFAAGLTVAVMGVPQAMAYALIAGLPPVYGLYTAIVPCLVAAVTGSSNHLVTGPTNALSMVTLSLATPLVTEYAGRGLTQIEAVLLLTLLAGLIQLAFGLLRMGGIIRYVSNSVIIGFTAGAGVLIAANQLKNLFGIRLPGGGGTHFFAVIAAACSHLQLANPFAFALGAITAGVTWYAPRLSRRIPPALAGIALATALSFAAGLHDRERWGELKVAIVKDIEPIRGTLQMFHIPEQVRRPDLDIINGLATGALAIALLGLIEAASISRSVAAQSKQRLDFNREFVGQGAANVVGAFFSSFVASGSFTRTAVCFGAGGRTRAAAASSGICTAVMVVALAPLANYIPQASLAGLLMVIAFRMVDKHRMVLTWRSGRNSQIVLGGTLLATLVLPLESAIFVGVFLSIGILLRITGRADLTQLMPRADGGFEEMPFERAPPSPVVTINMEGDLYFAAVEDLDYELLQALTPETRVIVLRMKRLRAVGSTAMAILEHFSDILRERNVHLVVCGIEAELKKVMTGSGLRKTIGELNIFYADNRLLLSTELALARAWSIVEMERQRRPEAEAPAAAAAEVLAASLMSRRSIRFGNQHQLREAVWLLSEMYKRHAVESAPTLFLQDHEGRLAGMLTPHIMVRELARDLPATGGGDLGSATLGELLRRRFDTPIATVARTDIPQLTAQDNLARVLRAVTASRLTALPVLDTGGRLVGKLECERIVAAAGNLFGLGAPTTTAGQPPAATAAAGAGGTTDAIAL